MMVITALRWSHSNGERRSRERRQEKGCYCDIMVLSLDSWTMRLSSLCNRQSTHAVLRHRCAALGILGWWRSLCGPENCQEAQRGGYVERLTWISSSWVQRGVSQCMHQRPSPGPPLSYSLRLSIANQRMQQCYRSSAHMLLYCRTYDFLDFGNHVRSLGIQMLGSNGAQQHI